MINAEIEKDFTFLTSIHFEDKFFVNLYEMKAYMQILTENAIEQNIAIERLNYFLGEYIDSAVLVKESEEDAINKYRAAGLKICTTPEEPFDQIVGMILINKCNAIMEGRIVMSDITFGSKLSNLIKFNIDHETAAAEFAGKYWYNKPTLSLHNKTKKDKIVNLFEQNDWKDVGLTWKEK